MVLLVSVVARTNHTFNANVIVKTIGLENQVWFKGYCLRLNNFYNKVVPEQ